MKRILILALIASLGLLQGASAADKGKKGRGGAVRAARPAAHARANVQRNVNVQRHGNVQARRLNVQRNTNVRRNVNVQRHGNVQGIARRSANQTARNRNVQRVRTRNINNTVNANRHLERNQQSKFNRQQGLANRQNQVVRNQNRAIRNQNRVIRNQNRVIRNRNSYADARRRFNWHHRHDRNWWRHNWGHTRFVLFGGGYYFWNDGYWYPAYGYDPAYSTYAYDEPIYGYDQLPPDQVIRNVQIQLQQEGYYEGDIDGTIGPMTRSAVARYQSDHGLVVTSAIDEPLLDALGLA